MAVILHEENETPQPTMPIPYSTVYSVDEISLTVALPARVTFHFVLSAPLRVQKPEYPRLQALQIERERGCVRQGYASRCGKDIRKVTPCDHTWNRVHTALQCQSTLTVITTTNCVLTALSSDAR